MTFYAARSKKSDMFFVFVEYCEDGYGAYEDNISAFSIEQGDMPKFFTQHAIDQPIYTEFKDHERTDIEFVEFTITMNPV